MFVQMVMLDFQLPMFLGSSILLYQNYARDMVDYLVIVSLVSNVFLLLHHSFCLNICQQKNMLLLQYNYQLCLRSQQTIHAQY